MHLIIFSHKGSTLFFPLFTYYLHTLYCLYHVTPKFIVSKKLFFSYCIIIIKMSLDFSNPVVRADVLYANKVVITEPVVDRSGYEFFDDFSSSVLDADVWINNAGGATILPGTACGVVRLPLGNRIRSTNLAGTITNFPIVSGLVATMRAKLTTASQVDAAASFDIVSTTTQISFTFGPTGCTLEVQNSGSPVLSSAFSLVSGQWYTFSINVVGDQVYVSVDGNQKISIPVSPSWFSSAGSSYVSVLMSDAGTLDVDFVSVSSPRV